MTEVAISPSSPLLDKHQIDEPATTRSLESGKNVLIPGPPGMGKTHLSSAVGLVAAQHRFSTYYVNCHQRTAEKPQNFFAVFLQY